MRDFNFELDTFRKTQPASEECAKLFLQQMVLSLKDVLNTERAIAKVNGARMLTLLVKEAGSEEAADALLTALKDKEQNDGVKYWALVGLSRAV